MVGQGHDFIAKGVVEVAREFLFRQVCNDVLGQVRTTDIPDKQGVPGNDPVHLVLFVYQQVGGALHRMPGRMDHLNLVVSNFEDLSVCGDDGLITGLGIGAENDGSTRFLLQVQVPADKVRVKMRFKNVFDLRIVNLGPVDVGLNFP